MGIGMFINHVAGFYLSGAQWNRCIISDPYIDEMYDKAAAEFDYYKRNEILKELNLYLIEQCHAIIPPDQVNWCAWQPWVMGYQGEANIGHGGYSQGAILAYIWLDQDLRYEMAGIR
jgi:ABC-type transport system substrate-binding protein